MHPAPSMFVTAGKGPFGDHYATTLAHGAGVALRERRRVTVPEERKSACIDFEAADGWYHDHHDEWLDAWDAEAIDPHISGYDYFMSQALWLLHLGWYFPDAPVWGDGTSPILAMPGAGQLTNVPTVIHIACKTLTGTVRLDQRITERGDLEYRYRHWLSDPRNLDPNTVMVDIQAFEDKRTYQPHLHIEGHVALRYDTGWVDTHTTPDYFFMFGTGFYLHELLHQEVYFIFNQSMKLPRKWIIGDGILAAAQNNVVRVYKPYVAKRSQLESIYGYLKWSVRTLRRRSLYTWYGIVVDVRIRQRPTYRSQVGTIALNAVYDQVNYQYTYKIRGRLKKVIKANPLPRGQVSPTQFYFLARVSNPHDLRVPVSLRYDGMMVNLNTPRGVQVEFDTAQHPVIYTPH